jgi:drug/metabolite transporter (DMT)-like permease
LNVLKTLSTAAPIAARQNTAWRYVIIMLISAFAGSWAGILGRLAQGEGVPTPYIIAFRQVVGVLVLTPFVFTVYRDSLRSIRKRDMLFAAITGFWLALHLLMGFASLEYTSVLVGAVIGGSAPIWIALAEVFILRHALGKAVWIGLFVTISGGLLIAFASVSDLSLGSNPLLGAVLALGSALTGAAYSLLGRGARKRAHLVPFLWMTFFFAGIVSGAVVVVQRIPLTGYTPAAYGYMLLLVVLAQLFAHLTYNYVLRRVPATITAVMGQLGVVIAAILAFFLFSEVPTPLELVGSVIIIAGITIVNRGQRSPGDTPA